MRILQVLRAPVGGLFRHVCDLTIALAAQGHEVGIVVDSLANDGQTEAKLAALAPHAALGIHRYAMPRLFGSGDLKTPFAISALAKKLEIEILHGHGAKGGFYARLARYGGSKAKVFYTPHGGVLHYPKSSASGRVFHALERHLMRQTKAIIFESAFAEATYTALIGKPTCPTEVIYNGLRADEFVPVVTNRDAADFVYVGELRPLKGIFELVEALARLKNAEGQVPSLVMAGDGASRPELEALIDRLGITDRVTLIGSQPARHAFAQGKCAVLPSHAESLPYVVLEAIAARLPVITTRVGGVPEIFGDAADLLLPAQDVEALARAMQAQLDGDLQGRIKQNALLQRVQQIFTIDQMFENIAKLYQRN